MSQRTVILENNTGGDITVVDLSSIVVPGSGQIDLTNLFTLYEVQKSAELELHIDSGDILINTGSETLDSNVSSNYLTPMAVVTDDDPNVDIEENTANRHTQIHDFAGPDHTATLKANVESKISDVSLLLSNAASEINSFTEVTDLANLGADTTWALVEDGDLSDAKRKITIENLVLSAGGIVDGAFSESPATDSTSSLTYVTKLELLIPVISGKIYRLGYSMEFNAGNNNKQVAVRFYNNTDAVAFGESVQQTNSSANFFVFAGFSYFTAGVTETKQLLLQYRIVTSGTSCDVRNAAIEVFEIVS